MQRCTNIFFGIFFRDGSVFNKNVFGFFLEWFKSRDTIRAHMNYVHVQGPQKCDTCGKISANRKALRKHQTIHMESWKDRFKCVICCKGFRDSTKLKVRFLDFIQIQFLAERFFFSICLLISGTFIYSYRNYRRIFLPILWPIISFWIFFVSASNEISSS